MSTTRLFRHGSLRLQVFAVIGDHGENCAVEDLFNPDPFFAATFHVLGAHFLGNAKPLLCCDGCQSLRLEHVDARLLVAEIRLKANKDERGIRTEMKDFRVPLLEISMELLDRLPLEQL